MTGCGFNSGKITGYFETPCSQARSEFSVIVNKTLELDSNAWKNGKEAHRWGVAE